MAEHVEEAAREVAHQDEHDEQLQQGDEPACSKHLVLAHTTGSEMSQRAANTSSWHTQQAER